MLNTAFGIGLYHKFILIFVIFTQCVYVCAMRACECVSFLKSVVGVFKQDLALKASLWLLKKKNVSKLKNRTRSCCRSQRTQF